MHARRFLRSWWTAAAAETCLLAGMARHGDFLRAGEAWRFTVLGVLAGAAYALAVRRFLCAPLSAAQRTRWFWAASVVLRLAILPVLAGDDVWRYRWEGRIQLHGFNPYQLAPDAPALAGLRDDAWTRISHRDFPAIYPPLTELTFAALSAARLPVPGYKLLFGLVDLGVVFLLRRLLACAGRPPDGAAWYAWNPLAVYAAAGAAHFDGLMLATLLWAIYLLDRAAVGNTPGSWRVPRAAWGSATLLGVAAAFKVVPLALVPVWCFALGWRRAVLALPATLVIPPLLATLYGFPAVPVFAALGRFARGFRVNEPVWWLVDVFRPPAPMPANDPCQIVAVLACGALAVWFRRDWRRGAWWVMGAALLLSPVVHAWYVVWVLPLAVWRGPAAARPWLVLSVSMFGYFLLWEVNHASGRPWQEPLWLRLLIYLPPAVTLLAGIKTPARASTA